jgi:hypothetical protein
MGGVMITYVKPKSLFLQNYHMPAHLQGSGAPITPDCAEEGTQCETTGMGYSCTPGSDWLILFELVNTNCEETPNPLTDLNCQIIESAEEPRTLQGCTLFSACTDQGCDGSAIYEVICDAAANEGDCGNNDVISVQCSVGGNEVCENNNPQV